MMNDWIVFSCLGITTFAMVMIGMTLDKVVRSLDRLADEAKEANRRKEA